MHRLCSARPRTPLFAAQSLLLLVAVGLLSGRATAQYTQLDICSSSTYYMSMDSTSSSSDAVEVISHSGINSGTAEGTSTSCTITLYPSGSNDEVALVAGYVDSVSTESTSIRVGSGTSSIMQINTLYKSSSSITISHTLTSSGRGFRATVFGVPSSLSDFSMCDYDGRSLPSNALTRVLSHSSAGSSHYLDNLHCETDVATSSSIVTYGFFDFFELESCCDRVQFNSETLSSSSVLVVQGDTEANNLVFSTDRSISRDGFILDLYRVAGTATATNSNERPTTYLICDSISASSTLGVIRSHAESGSASYDNNLSCSMSISVPEGHVVAFYLEDYELESCCDELSITYDSSTATSFNDGPTFASSNAGQDVQLSFTTDGSITRTGFTLYYQIVSSTSGTVAWTSLIDATAVSTTTAFPESISTNTYTVCSSSSITGVEAGVIFSHRDYGGTSSEDKYDNSLYCTLVVYPLDNNDYVHIYVDEIDLESTDDLEFTSGTSSSVELTRSGETYVGERGQSVRIVFDTDSSVRRDGFKLLFQSSTSSASVPFSWSTVSSAADDPGSGGGGYSVSFPFGAIPGIVFAVVLFCIITVSMYINFKARRARADRAVHVYPPVMHGRNMRTTTNNNNNNSNSNTSNTTNTTAATSSAGGRTQAAGQEPLPSYATIAHTPNGAGSGATSTTAGGPTHQSGVAETPITAATFLSSTTVQHTSPGLGGGSGAYPPTPAYPPSPAYPPGPAYPPTSPPTAGTYGAQTSSSNAPATAPSYADAPPSYNALFSGSNA